MFPTTHLLQRHRPRGAGRVVGALGDALQGSLGALAGHGLLVGGEEDGGLLLAAAGPLEGGELGVGARRVLDGKRPATALVMGEAIVLSVCCVWRL